MKIGYARVSTQEQNLARQIEKLQEIGCDKIYEEKQSGKNMSDREVLNMMLDCGIREGDTVYVVDFSRLARNCGDLLRIADIVREKGVGLVSLKEGVDIGTPMGQMVMTVLGSIYQFERENIRERQAQGIAIAKREGKYQGGQRKKIDENVFEALYARYQNKEINKVSFASSLKVSRPTLDKLLKEKKPAENINR